MRPIGFVICIREIGVYHYITPGKIYPYYKSRKLFDGDWHIEFMNDNGIETGTYMLLELKSQNDHYFDFFTPPEFPEDISTWTKDDWFQYDLKYG